MVVIVQHHLQTTIDKLFFGNTCKHTVIAAQSHTVQGFLATPDNAYLHNL
jgi:hypothetical protein